MKKASVNLVVGIVFIFMAVLFGTIGFVMNRVMNKPINNMVEVMGTITEIYEYDEDDTTVYVEFEDTKGNLNKVKSDFYSTSMREGDKIKVYYNSENPKEFRVDDHGVSKIILYVFTGVGVILLIIALALIYIYIKSKRHLKEVMESGIIVYGKITSVRENRLYNINGRFPYKIVVNFTYNNLSYDIESDNMWTNPQNVIDSYGIVELPVYIDTNNPKNSVVDFNEIKNKLG